MTKQIEWKLVPVEPTAEMLRCGQYQDDGVEGTYARMLAAAPPAEQAPVAYQRRGNDGIMTGHLVLRNDIGERTIATGAWIPLYRHPSADQSAKIERLRELLRGLSDAAELVLAWYEAEEDHSKEPDFYSRVAMCKTSGAELRAALAAVKPAGQKGGDRG